MENIRSILDIIWMLFFLSAIGGGLLLACMLFFLAKSMRINDKAFYDEYFLKKKSVWSIAIDEKFNSYLKNKNYLEVKDRRHIRLCDAYGRLSNLYDYLLWMTFALFLAVALYK